MKSAINWRIFLILLISSLLSVLAVFPYVLTIQGDILRQVNIPITALVLAQLIQCAILFSIAIFFGLLLVKKTSFRLPILEALVSKKDFKKIFKDIFGLSFISGIFSAVAIYAVDHIFTIDGSAISTSQSYAPIWQKLLASFYGGITEEILLRLFLMSLFIWIGMKVTKRTQPSKTGIIASIILAAIIFGLGHLPITASLTRITPLVIARAIVLNGIGGVIFGWLFWKKGLESAIIAHFTADIFLLTLLPLILK